MFNVNVAAILLNSLYLGFYLTYALDKYQEVIVPALKGSALIAILLTYVAYENPDLVEFRYSFIVTALMLLLMGSPLAEVVIIFWLFVPWTYKICWVIALSTNFACVVYLNFYFVK